jgi:hypothetical protein
MLHQFAPGHSLVWMLKPRAKVVFQFGKPLFDAGLTVVEAHLHAI